MSRKVQNLLWLPAIALSGSAHALGLGDLHVTSALNEPLAAQIDIVGATPEELSNIRAAIANRDTFQRYGADRPAFLGTANFKVSQDKYGRPVLLVRSTDAFTEPLVSLLVDLRWSSGELVREYTLLLDPAISASSASRLPEPATDLSREEPARVAAAPRASSPMSHRLAATPPAEPAPAAPLPGTPASGGEAYVVARRDTLGAVARRSGAKTESDLLKTMVAIFHANPDAFSGNINRLRVGATLTIPSSAVIAAIPERAASLEVHAQMLAWHAAAGSLVALAQTGQTPAASAAVAVARGADAEAIKDLTNRIDALQQGLAELKRQEEQHGAAAPVAAPSPAVPVASSAPAPSPWVDAPASANAAPTPVAQTNTETSPAVAADAAPVAVETVGEAPPAKQSHGGLIAGAFVLLAAAVGFAYRRYRRRADDESDDAFGTEPVDRYGAFKPSLASQPQREQPRTEQPQPEIPATVESQPIYRLPPRSQIFTDEDAGVETILEGDTARCRVITPEELIMDEESGEHERIGETTVTVALTAVTAYDPTVELPKRDAVEFESPSMDLENSETHVNMPSGLHDQVAFKERRVNAADVLRSAIERAPDRIDLRVKLMELYHSTAAINRQGFIDAARRFAQQPDYQSTAEWEKIAAMGRQIAPEDPLFALDPTVQHEKLSEKLADCA